jgi:CHAT domain-containing protein
VHLATHGFFLPGPNHESRDPTKERKRPDILSRLEQMADPLLRSGVVLTSADRPLRKGDLAEAEPAPEGVVTAEEIAHLNMGGCELVVLSTGETGLGDVRTGQGVYGLSRAFTYAGAQTALTTLYHVPDRASARLMVLFSQGLAKGKEKLEALRDAQLQLIAERREDYGAAHPFFWGGYVLVGNPR